MKKYVELGVYCDTRTEKQVMLVEKITNTGFWIADPFDDKEQYIIVNESHLLKKVY